MNSQISVKNKTGLGYDSHVNEFEVLDNVVDSVSPYTGNFKSTRADLSFAGLDDSVYKPKVSENIFSKDSLDTTASETSKESLEKPKTVRPSAPIIEDWKSDSCDPLSLLDGFTLVEDNAVLLETRFEEESIFVYVVPTDVTGSANLTLLSLFFRVTATKLSLGLLMLG
ncbi:hypothetical protein Tco_0127440 [Tanacetum coccineum]